MIDARWAGALDTPVEVTLALRDIAPHDYRSANNRAVSSVIFTRKPELVVQPWRTLALEGGVARLAVDVANDSLVNPALATELLVTVPAGLSVASIDSRCMEQGAGVRLARLQPVPGIVLPSRPSSIAMAMISLATRTLVPHWC